MHLSTMSRSFSDKPSIAIRLKQLSPNWCVIRWEATRCRAALVQAAPITVQHQSTPRQLFVPPRVRDSAWTSIDRRAIQETKPFGQAGRVRKVAGVSCNTSSRIRPIGVNPRCKCPGHLNLTRSHQPNRTESRKDVCPSTATHPKSMSPTRSTRKMLLKDLTTPK
jgi:hypothetical protein